MLLFFHVKFVLFFLLAVLVAWREILSRKDAKHAKLDFCNCARMLFLSCPFRAKILPIVYTRGFAPGYCKLSLQDGNFQD